MSVKKEIFDWIKSIAMAIVLAFVILQFIRPSIVSGESMYPTLDDKDYLILNRISYKGFSGYGRSVPYDTGRRYCSF